VLIRVLGSAAGGGFPQWNCNCRNCSGVRDGSLRALARSQSSIAVTSDRSHWVLCNASPDIHRQLATHLPLPTDGDARSSPIAAVILVDGQIDHAAGLLLLRENNVPLDVWTTDSVREDLSTGLPLFPVLEHYCGIDWHRLAIDESPTQVPALDGLSVTAVPVAGMPGPYSPHRSAPRDGDTVALLFRDATSNRQLFYGPGIGEFTPAVRAAMRASDCVLVDGTFWRDDEMIRAGVSTKRAREIGHLPQGGDGGMLDELAQLPTGTRKVLIHINNTNPVLDEASPERAMLAAAGVELAYDGMDIEL
jgi:pyrroloquinoline quinone biosynthesis protein B